MERTAVSVHIGKRKYYQIGGAGITVSTITNPDPQLVTATINSLDRTEYALDGIAAGVTNLALNNISGGVAQQPTYLEVTVLPLAAGEVTSAALSGHTSEVDAGTAFP